MIVERRTIDIPEGVEIQVEGRKVTVIGEKGRVERDFSHVPALITIRKEGTSIVVEVPWPKKKEKAIVGTVAAHIKNMIRGVTKGFTYKLIIVTSHFPVTAEVRGREVIIKNFYGERVPRIAKIVGKSEVSVKGDIIEVKGVDIEEVAQTAANIQMATKVKKRDPRVFLDGIYIFEKLEGM